MTLALLKLRARSLWNTLTHGGIKGIGTDPDHETLTFTEFLRRWFEATATAETARGQEDEITAAGATRDQQMTDEFGALDDEYDDEDLWDSLLVLGIAAALAVAVYYRQWRQRRREQERAQEEGGAGAAAGGQPMPPVGIWGDPGMPGWGMPH